MDTKQPHTSLGLSLFFLGGGDWGSAVVHLMVIPQCCIAHPYSTKLDSEINVPFLLNEHGELGFLSHNNGVHIILFNLREEQFLSDRKEDTDESVQNRYSGMQIMTAKTTTVRTLYVHVVLNCVIFRHFHMILFHMFDTFYMPSFFLSSTLINYASSYRKIQFGPMDNARD